MPKIRRIIIRNRIQNTLPSSSTICVGSNKHYVHSSSKKQAKYNINIAASIYQDMQVINFLMQIVHCFYI